MVLKLLMCSTMSARAAELTKIAVNCYLTTKITYANQVGQVMIRDGMEDEIEQFSKQLVVIVELEQSILIMDLVLVNFLFS